MMMMTVMLSDNDNESVDLHVYAESLPSRHTAVI